MKIEKLPMVRVATLVLLGVGAGCGGAPPAPAPPVHAAHVDDGVASDFKPDLTQPDFVGYRSSMNEAIAAYERKDYAAFLASTERAALALPNGPRAMYKVACGYALTCIRAEAIAQLEKLANMNLFFDVQKDDDLASLRNLPQFVAVSDRFAAVEKTILGRSVPAFTLPERDTIPEGIAYDPHTKAFFVSSVHKRKIVRILPNGTAEDFAAKDLFAVLGMAVDEKRRTLWACSSSVPEMNGFTEADKGHAKLAEFDIDSGKMRRALPLDEPGVNHMCNDVTLDPQGNVYVSDPTSSTVFVLPAGGTTLGPFVPAGRLGAPQGMAFMNDGESMFVADYARGLFHVDRKTREVTFVAPPKDATLLGIDGLTVYQGDLIAIQNGVRPHRVLRIAVDIGTRSVRRVDVLQMNHPAFIEPTLGVVVGKELFYVANSQWGRFDKGVIWPVEKLKEPVILKLGLE